MEGPQGRGWPPATTRLDWRTSLVLLTLLPCFTYALEMFAVLGVWAAIGLVLAPILLRRMPQGQSGSALAKVRERYMSKGY